MSTLSFVILSDDHAAAPYAAEHGFCLHIVLNGKNILFDTGQWALPLNAERAGIDLAKVDECVISHGHYDHTGGIALLLEKNRHVRFWIHRDAALPHFRDADGTAKVLTMSDKDRRALKALPVHRLRHASFSAGITRDAGIVCPIPHTHPLEDTGGRFFRDLKLTQPDPIDDELALWIRHGKGLIIVTGCCHAGFINTCEAVKKETGIDRVHAVIGGLHLQSATDERIAATCDYIIQEGISAVVPCHCSGLDAVEKMRARLGCIVREGLCGERFTV